MTDLLGGLNSEQQAAVSAPDGHHLVLAGAGSGKTRVLTRRIAWLHQQHAVPLHGMVAVTFTNKAAREMRDRLLALLGPAASALWIGTFHGLSNRILRMHPLEAGLPDDFQILDSDDQLRLVKQVLADFDIDDGKIPPREAVAWISRHKDDGLRPGQVPVKTPLDGMMRSVFFSYQERCDRLGLADFGELLLRCHELFENQPALLAHYQKRFQYLLVDEFQDTNMVQYKWVRSLLGDTGRGFVVADDAQAIYGWRGARVDNVLRFVDEHSASIWRLEQNYRSTGAILAAANTLIAKNPTREDFKKRLWTEQAEGEAIKRVETRTEVEEAEVVSAGIARCLEAGVPANECAVLYRSNAQSRVLEESLLARSIPYKIYGGQRFFDCMEVKDAIAYLRLSANRSDDISFERIINTPTRGIGATTLDAIRVLSSRRETSRWNAAQAFVADGTNPARARSAVQAFLDLIVELDEAASSSLEDRLRRIIQQTGLRAYHEKLSKGETNSRSDNLDELVSVGSRFRQAEDEAAMGWSLTQSFLSQVSLEPVDAQSVKETDQVQLMTIHSAKGLEFDVVFLVGWEEGLFPSGKSLEDPERLEEERRLAYVAITRARKKLAILHAASRRIYGRLQEAIPSRFLADIPLSNKSSGKPSVSPSSLPRSALPLPSPPGEFRPGQNVQHPTWGAGIVVKKDPSQRYMVAFKGVGAKWVALSDRTLVASREH